MPESKWETVSTGGVDHPNVQHAQLRERTERLDVAGRGSLFRTTVFDKDFKVVSVALTSLPAR